MPQSFGTQQELLQDLAQQMLTVPALREALQIVVLKGTSPKAQVYISSPQDASLADPWTRNYYQIGAKISYCSHEGIWEQFGQIIRWGGGIVNPLQYPTAVGHTLNVLGHQLADAILLHEEAKRPLPIQSLTAQDRAEIQRGLPF